MPTYGQIPSLEVRKTADKFMRTNTDWADAAGSNLVPPQEIGPSAGVGVAVVGALEQRHPEAGDRTDHDEFRT